MEFYACHIVELTRKIGDEPLVIGCYLWFQSPCIIDGVDTEVMVEMAMGTQKVYGLEVVVVDVFYKCIALGIVVGAAVDDDALEAIIAHYISVLLKEIETEGLDVKHYNGR
jgi:hypothetical protein